MQWMADERAGETTIGTYAPGFYHIQWWMLVLSGNDVFCPKVDCNPNNPRNWEQNDLDHAKFLKCLVRMLLILSLRITYVFTQLCMSSYDAIFLSDQGYIIAYPSSTDAFPDKFRPWIRSWVCSTTKRGVVKFPKWAKKEGWDWIGHAGKNSAHARSACTSVWRWTQACRRGAWSREIDSLRLLGDRISLGPKPSYLFSPVASPLSLALH
jgi:hypothetical protein